MARDHEGNRDHTASAEKNGKAGESPKHGSEMRYSSRIKSSKVMAVVRSRSNDAGFAAEKGFFGLFLRRLGTNIS